MLGAVSPWAIRLKLERVEDSGETAGRHVRDLDGRLAGRHVPRRAAADPAGRHAAHVPDLRARARRSSPRSGSARRWLARARSASPRCSRSRSARSRRPRTARVIHETETTYQYARVVEHPDGDAPARAQRGPGDPLALPARHACSPAATGTASSSTPFAAPRRRRRARIAILGIAGGTIAARLRALLPEHARSTRSRSTASCSTSATATSACARARSCASTPRTRGRSCASTTARYDAIFVDAYRQPYIPFYLTTQRVLRARRATGSRPAASVIVNVGHPEGSRRAREGAHRDDGRRAFDARRARPDRADQHAADRLATRRSSAARPARGRAGCRPTCARSRSRAAGRLAAAAAAAARVYTDDKAPVEWLIDKSIVEYAAGG